MEDKIEALEKRIAALEVRIQEQRERKFELATNELELNSNLIEITPEQLRELLFDPRYREVMNDAYCHDLKLKSRQSIGYYTRYLNNSVRDALNGKKIDIEALNALESAMRLLRILERD